MELLIGGCVIIVLMLILGVSPAMIIMILICLMWLMLLILTIFFVINLILLLMTKKTTGEFLRMEYKNNQPLKSHAVYLIDGQEEKNTFPAEVILINQIYKTGKQVAVWYKTGKNFRIVFDWYSLIVILTGLPVFVSMTYAFGLFASVMMKYFIK